MNVNRLKWFPWQKKPGENTQMNYAKPTHSTFSIQFTSWMLRESTGLCSLNVKFLNELRLWAGKCMFTPLTAISCCEL